MTSTRRRWLIVLGVFFAVGCGGAALLATHLFQGRRAALDAVMDDLRARGEPTSLADLDADPPRPEDDGGPLLRDAWASLEANPPPVDTLPSAAFASQVEFERLDPDARVEVSAYVRRMQPTLSSMHEALESPGWRPAGSPELFPVVHCVPHLQRSHLALTLALRCVSAESVTDAGPSASAARLRVLRTAGLLGVRWRRPWSWAEHLVQLTLIRSALNLTRDQLEAQNITGRAAEEALAPLLSFDSRAAVLESLRTQRVTTVVLVRRFAGDDSGPLPTGIDYDGSSAWQDALARRALIDGLAPVEAALALEEPTWPALSVAVRPLGERMSNLRFVEGYGPSLVSVSLYGAPLTVSAGARLAATQSLARLALAAVAQFELTGVWPARLGEIDVPDACRIDPFTDEPFVFERLPDGIRLSSSGPTDRAIWGDKPVDQNDPQADGLVWTLRR